MAYLLDTSFTATAPGLTVDEKVGIHVDVRSISPSDDYENDVSLSEDVPTPLIQPLDSFSPIMSRLPRDFEPEDSRLNDVGEGPDADVDVQDQDCHSYVQPSPRFPVPGTLRGAHNQYTNARLPVLTPADYEIWKALHDLRPLTTDYAGEFDVPAAFAPWKQLPATCPFTMTTASSSPDRRHHHASQSSLELVRRVLNWSALRLPLDTAGVFYGVVFRSRRDPASLSGRLYAADAAAHEEAVRAGGLLMYWYGVPDATTGMNLATCVWRSRADARRASALAKHREAARLAQAAYERFELGRYAVVKERGSGGVTVQRWREEYEAEAKRD